MKPIKLMTGLVATLSVLSTNAEAKIKPKKDPAIHAQINGQTIDLLNRQGPAHNTRGYLLGQTYSQNKVEVVIKPTMNLIDGAEYNRRFPLPATPYTQAAASKIFDGTSVIALRAIAGDQCVDPTPGVKRYVLETYISGLDETIELIQKGTSVFGEENLISADLGKGNFSSTDALFLSGELMECGSRRLGKGYTIDLAITKTGKDNSQYFFVKILGTYRNAIHTRDPGLTAALHKGMDLVNAPKSIKSTIYNDMVRDEVQTTARRTYKSQRSYFPRSEARKFKCDLEYSKRCDLVFDMPRGGRVGDIEEYMRSSASRRPIRFPCVRYQTSHFLYCDARPDGRPRTTCPLRHGPRFQISMATARGQGRPRSDMVPDFFGTRMARPGVRRRTLVRWTNAPADGPGRARASAANA